MGYVGFCNIDHPWDKEINTLELVTNIVWCIKTYYYHVSCEGKIRHMKSILQYMRI